MLILFVLQVKKHEDENAALDGEFNIVQLMPSGKQTRHPTVTCIPMQQLISGLGAEKFSK